MQTKLSRRSKKIRERSLEDRLIWRERAGIALTLAILTLIWLVLASDASAARDDADDAPFERTIAAGSMTMLTTMVSHEPETAIMTGLGLGGLAWVSRRQGRRNAADPS